MLLVHQNWISKMDTIYIYIYIERERERERERDTKHLVVMLRGAKTLSSLSIESTLNVHFNREKTLLSK